MMAHKNVVCAGDGRERWRRGGRRRGAGGAAVRAAHAQGHGGPGAAALLTPDRAARPRPPAPACTTRHCEAPHIFQSVKGEAAPRPVVEMCLDVVV